MKRNGVGTPSQYMSQHGGLDVDRGEPGRDHLLVGVRAAKRMFKPKGGAMRALSSRGEAFAAGCEDGPE